GFVRPRCDTDGLTGENPVWGRFWELAALSPEERTLIERTRDVVRRDLLAYGRPGARYGLIHADLVLENLLVDGSRIRIIDFDDAGEGWHLFDLATVLRLYLGTGHLNLVRDAMVEGDRNRRLLDDSDLKHLSLFLMARGLTYLAWMHTRRDTESARLKTPGMVTMACDLAERYLTGAQIA
ncbi:MAG: phosphotransferase, partial [bacterium]|nr:phosphotransferase [bacterium]